MHSLYIEKGSSRTTSNGVSSSMIMISGTFLKKMWKHLLRSFPNENNTCGVAEQCLTIE